MKTMSGLMRAGAAAFVLGLSLAGPQAAGVAGADDVGGESVTAPRGPKPAGAGPTVGVSGPAVRSVGAAGQRVKTAGMARSNENLPQTELDSAGPQAGANSSRFDADVRQPVGMRRSRTVIAPPPESAGPGPAALRALSNYVGVTSDALAGDDPTAPVELPLSWTVLAAASRKTLAPTASTRVVAIPQTPLLTALRLQEVPIIGPLVVMPIVTIVNHVPVVSDLLHPIVGYPLLPEGFVAPRDVRVVSFDGTGLNVHFMPASGLHAGQQAPTVLLASALGMPGATNLNGTPIDGLLANFGGQVGAAVLRNAGYNVVTWDLRGAYFSGGLLQMASPDYEARDVSAIINWLSEQPEAQLDGPADPRMGMAGGSYGGPVQLVAAATDHRIDAIVPVIAWNTLNSSVYPNGAFMSGLGAAPLLFALMRVNPRFFPAVIYGALTGDMRAADQDLMASRGPGPARGFPDLVSRITAPTLLIQGTVDTLVSPMQSDITATSLLAQGVPTKVLWFCGGHGLCINNLFDFSEGPLIEQRTVGWLDRYVKGESVSTGPGFEWVNQRGQHFATDTYPAPASEPIVASLSAADVLPLFPFMGGSGPMLFVLPLGGTKALNAVNLETPVGTTTAHIVGAPELTITYTGTGNGDHVYAQLVDNSTRLVLGNQVTPIPVTLDGQTHTLSVPLQPVAHTLLPGETITLQLCAWSANYAANPSLGMLTIADMRVSLPTTADSSAT